MTSEIGGATIADTKRRLLSLSATVGVVLIVIVIVAIYGMHRLDGVVAGSQVEIGRLAELAEGARVAQVTFKTQVQEWKNTLLRGYKTDDFAAYHGAFLARRADVQTELGALALQAQALGFPTEGLAALKAQHAGLGKAYDEALAAFKADDPLSSRIVDAHVRGRDRPVNEAFDQFVAQVKTFTDERRAALGRDVAGVAAGMRATLWTALAVGMAVLFLAVFMAMRAIHG